MSKFQIEKEAQAEIPSPFHPYAQPIDVSELGRGRNTNQPALRAGAKTRPGRAKYH